MKKPKTQPKLVDHKNMVVYYPEEELGGVQQRGELCEYWGQTAPYYAVGIYDGDDSKQVATVTKNNIKLAEEKDKNKAKDDKIADLEARLLKLENK